MKATLRVTMKKKTQSLLLNWCHRYDGLSQQQVMLLCQLDTSRIATQSTYINMILVIAVISATLAMVRRIGTLSPIVDRIMVKILHAFGAVRHHVHTIRSGDREILS